MSVAERLWTHIQGMVGKGTTTAAPVDTGPQQLIQHKLNEMQVRDAVGVMYHFGFTACLPVGSDVVSVNISGTAGNGVIVATGHQPSRKTGLNPGEAMLYNLAGDHVYMRNGGTIEIISGTTVTVTAPTVAITGNVTCTGSIVANGDVIAGSISLQNHVNTNVQPGGSNTGPPVG